MNVFFFAKSEDYIFGSSALINRKMYTKYTFFYKTDIYKNTSLRLCKQNAEPHT